MPNTCVLRLSRVVATILVIALACQSQLVRGQTSPGSLLPNGLLPLLNREPPVSAVSTAAYQQPMNMPMMMPRRAPLARLIENPDQTDGAPPFALTDQTGTIQRYVEPVPGIDLSRHIGQVVSVRNDTGSTLLASQLELPAPMLQPMLGNPDNLYASAESAAGTRWRSMESAGEVQQVQYVDNDDASVQLLPDGGSVVDPSAMGTGGLMPFDGMPPAGQFPPYAEQVGPPGMVGPMYPPNMPMQYPPGMMGYPTAGNDMQPDRARLSVDVQLMMLRPQIAETATGKLSEEYQFSPRLILGLRGAGNFDGRVRYWHYNRNSDVLGSDDDIRLKFDVLDVEAIHHFAARKSELVLSAGLRLAGIRLTDVEGAKCSTDLIGLTMAGDGMTPLGRFSGGHFGLVYGGRLAILGGDWGGDDDSEFVDQQTRNDNVLVHELYGGVELARRFRTLDIHVRLLFEMQNWQSDVLATDADVESIGLLGPGLQLGAEF